MLETKIACQLEFRVTDSERYAAFERFFATLSAWTQQRYSGSGTTAIDETQQVRAVNPRMSQLEDSTTKDRSANWLLVLRPSDLELLGMPPHLDSLQWVGKWRTLSRAERREQLKGNASLQALAEFVDMLKQFEDVPCELMSCTRPAPDIARLAYQAPSITPKLKSALENLLMCFGFYSVLRDDC